MQREAGAASSMARAAPGVKLKRAVADCGAAQAEGLDELGRAWQLLTPP